MASRSARRPGGISSASLCQLISANQGRRSTTIEEDARCFHLFLSSLFFLPKEAAEEHKAQRIVAIKAQPQGSNTDLKIKTVNGGGAQRRGAQRTVNGGGAQRTGAQRTGAQRTEERKHGSTEEEHNGRVHTVSTVLWRGGRWSFHRFLPLLPFQAMAEEQKNGTARHG
ncbi:unnamed protein product [Closterium sp. Yama58-4]|nr:unnamed protein product [Closterium sp. Yama58-4]